MKKLYTILSILGSLASIIALIKPDFFKIDQKYNEVIRISGLLGVVICVLISAILLWHNIKKSKENRIITVKENEMYFDKYTGISISVSDIYSKNPNVKFTNIDGKQYEIKLKIGDYWEFVVSSRNYRIFLKNITYRTYIFYMVYIP